MKQYKSFINRARKHLLCSAASKKRFVKRCQRDISLFLEENPEYTYEEVVKTFGSPWQMAQNFMETLDNQEIIDAKSKRKLLGLIVGVLGIVMAIIVLILLLNPNFRPHVTVTTTIYSDEELPKEYEDLLSESGTLDESPK